MKFPVLVTLFSCDAVRAPLDAWTFAFKCGLRSPVPSVHELADVAEAYNRMANAMEASEEDFAALADRSPDGVLRSAF